MTEVFSIEYLRDIHVMSGGSRGERGDEFDAAIAATVGVCRLDSAGSRPAPFCRQSCKPRDGRELPAAHHVIPHGCDHQRLRGLRQDRIKPGELP